VQEDNKHITKNNKKEINKKENQKNTMGPHITERPCRPAKQTSLLMTAPTVRGQPMTGLGSHTQHLQATCGQTSIIQQVSAIWA